MYGIVRPSQPEESWESRFPPVFRRLLSVCAIFFKITSWLNIEARFRLCRGRWPFNCGRDGLANGAHLPTFKNDNRYENVTTSLPGDQDCWKIYSHGDGHYRQMEGSRRKALGEKTLACMVRLATKVLGWKQVVGTETCVAPELVAREGSQAVCGKSRRPPHCLSWRGWTRSHPGKGGRSISRETYKLTVFLSFFRRYREAQRAWATATRLVYISELTNHIWYASIFSYELSDSLTFRNISTYSQAYHRRYRQRGCSTVYIRITVRSSYIVWYA